MKVSVPMSAVVPYTRSGKPPRRSRAVGLLASAGAVLGLLAAATAAAAGAATKPNTPTGGATSTGTSTAPALHFGVVDGNLLSESPSQISTSLHNEAALGVTYIREQLSWNAVEPQPGTYNWTAFDNVVKGVAAQHMHLLALIDFTPSWARPSGCAIWSCAPAEPSQFATFAAAAAARYAPYGVHDWEIWNEPNSVGFWQPAPSAAAYTALLSDTAASIRSADPQAFIVSGGLAPEPDANGNIDQVSFLQSVCGAGGLGLVDAVGDHPYSSPVPPSYLASWNAWSIMSQTTVNLRSVMTSCGAAAMPIWATEYGAPTNGPGPTATVSNLDLAGHPTHVDESLQATMATQAVQMGAADPWFGALFWYSYQDLGTATTTNQNFFGLVRYDGTAKPAWSAYQAAIAAVTSRPR